MTLTNEQIDDVVIRSRASQNKTELKMLLRYVVPTNPKVVVEIGMHQGYSLLDWCRAFKPEIAIGIQLGLESIDEQAVEEIRGMGVDLYILDADSQKEETRDRVRTILEKYDRKIDFLYIDGDHHYEAVKRDFEFYSPFVRPDGLIGFDDIMLTDFKYVEAGVEVNRFWNELIKAAGSKYFVFWDSDSFSGFGSGDGIYIKPEKPLL